MTNFDFVIGSQGVSGHLIAVLRSTLDLFTVVATVDTYPANNGNFQFLNIDPGVYRVEVRDSPDGTALGTQIGNPYSIKVEDTAFGLEHRFYSGGGGQLAADGITVIDPAVGQPDLNDPYLNGKTIDSVNKVGYGALIPIQEYNRTTTGIHLEGGVFFAQGEITEIVLATKIAQPIVTAKLFSGYGLITASRSLINTDENKLIECESTTTRLVITFPSIGSVTDSKFYYFTTYSGNQFQTKFITTGGETIKGYGTQIVLGANEKLWIEKRGSFWRVLEVSEGVDNVGKRFSARYGLHKNTLKEDDATYAALDYPRPHYFLVNILPATAKLIKTDAEIATYSRSADEAALPIVSDSFFRMPDSRNLSERALKAGSDSSRHTNDTGWYQPPMTGPHSHPVETQNLNGDAKFKRAANHSVRSWNAGPQVDLNQNSSTDINKQSDNSTDTTENRIANFGVIYVMNI